MVQQGVPYRLRQRRNKIVTDTWIIHEEFWGDHSADESNLLLSRRDAAEDRQRVGAGNVHLS